MGGVGILLIVGLYLALTVTVIVKVKPFWLKGLVLLLALLIPSADAVYGRYKLKKMCEADAGLKVYTVAHNVKGFMSLGSSSIYWVSDYGYQFAEDSPTNGLTSRYSKQDGQIVTVRKVAPKSKYRLVETLINIDDAFTRSQYSIVDRATQEILASDIRFAYMGGWVERFFAQFTGAGVGNVAWCVNNPYPQVRIENLVNACLKQFGEK